MAGCKVELTRRDFACELWQECSDESAAFKVVNGYCSGSSMDCSKTKDLLLTMDYLLCLDASF